MVGWLIPHPFQPLSRCLPVLQGLEGWRLHFLDSLAAKVWRPVRLCPLNAHVWDMEDKREAQVVFSSCLGCFGLVVKSLGFSAAMVSVSSHQRVGVQGMVMRTSSPPDPYIKANVTKFLKTAVPSFGVVVEAAASRVGRMTGTFWVIPGGPAHSLDLSIILQEPNFLT